MITAFLKLPLLTKVAAAAFAAGVIVGGATMVSWERGPFGLATKLGAARASIVELRAKNRACELKSQKLRKQRDTYANWTLGWQEFHKKESARIRSEAAASISTQIKSCKASRSWSFDEGVRYGQAHPTPDSQRPADGVRNPDDDFLAWYRRRAAERE